MQNRGVKGERAIMPDDEEVCAGCGATGCERAKGERALDDGGIRRAAADGGIDAPNRRTGVHDARLHHIFKNRAADAPFAQDLRIAHLQCIREHESGAGQAKCDRQEQGDSVHGSAAESLSKLIRPSGQSGRHCMIQLAEEGCETALAGTSARRMMILSL